MTESIMSFVGAFLIFSMVSLSRRYRPRYYFSFTDIIHGIDPAITWEAVVLRFSFPVLVGMLLAAVAPVLGVSATVNRQFIATNTGFLASVLLVLPGIANPEVLPYYASTRTRELRVIYVMFVFSYSMLGLAGGFLGISLATFLQQALHLSTVMGLVDALAPALGDIIKGIISAIIASPIVGLFAWAIKRIARKRTP